MAGQVPLDLLKATGLQIGFGPLLEVSLGDSPECNGCPGSALCLFRLGIPSELYLGQDSLGGLPRSVRVQCFGGADGYPPLLRADTILSNPRSLTTCAEPKAKAREVIVEDNVVGLARWKRELR
jgi:hypothetical protein